MQQFKVEAGTWGEVCRDGGQWKPWVTTTDLLFDEPVRRTRTSITFRRGAWLLKVKVIDVWMHNGMRWRKMS